MLLLDEPLNGLDLPNQAAVAALIGRICRQECVTVVMVTHDVNPVLSYLDRVVYIAESGVAAGTPSEVITGPTLSRLYGTTVEVLRTSDGHSGRPWPARSAAYRHGDPAASADQRMLAAMTLAGSPHLSWNPSTMLRELFAYPFMVNAFRAGTIVAVAAGSIGWFMVLRRQTFAGHTLALVGFPRGRGGHLGGRQRRLRLLRLLHRRGADPRAPSRRRRGQGYSDESAATGIRAGLRPGQRLPVHRPVPGLPERA